MKRESFASRIGFLLVSAGCAIGIGNVWRFPTVTGQYGGGVFVLFYLLFLVLMGAPVLTMELAVGRAGHGSAGTAYRALEPKGSKWHLHGWACLIGCCVLMMYYTTVTGWMVSYFGKFLTGGFHPWSVKGALYILGLCICATGGQFCLTRAFSRGNLVLSSSLQYTVILFSTILGEILFLEPATFPVICGMLIIVFSGLMSSYFVRRENKFLKEKAKTSQSKTA